MAIIDVSVTGQPQIELRLGRLDSAAITRRVLGRIAKDVVSNSKKRVRAQTDLHSQQWSPRKSAKRKKMLTKVGQAIKLLRLSANTAEIGFARSRTAQIAGKHQLGHSERITVEQVRRRPNQLAATARATRRQAAALLDVGFKIRRPARGGWKTPSKKWITENMSIGQAGAILRDLRTEQKTYWDIVLPPRSFLGVTASDAAALETAGLDEINAQLRV